MNTKSSLQDRLRLAADIEEKRLPWKTRYEEKEWVSPDSRGLSSPLHALACGFEIALDVPEPVDPFAELKAAHKAGKVIQIKGYAEQWNDLDHSPEWRAPIAEYRIKPEPEWVELEASDVPPGSVLRQLVDTPSVAFWLVRSASREGVYLHEDLWSWSSLMDDFEINRSLSTGKWDTTAWEKCAKLKGGQP